MPLSLVSTIALIVGVDVWKSKQEQDRFLLEEQAVRDGMEARVHGGAR